MSDPSARFFFGTWFTNLGPLVLFPGGQGVQGKYERRGGELAGRVDGGALRGSWYEAEGGPPEGEFELTLDGTGNYLQGQRRFNGEAAWSAKWWGVRTTLLPQGAGGFPAPYNCLPDGPLLCGPLLGEVSGDEARVWVQARDAGPLTLTLLGPAGPAEQVEQPRWEEWLCLVFSLRGLVPGQIYEYELHSAHGKTARYRLRAAPPREARRARFTFGSCFNHFERPDLPIFDAIGREDGDAFVMLGDNCYLDEQDWQTQHTMMLCNLRTRNNPSFRRLCAAVPVLAIWDDHDFGPNDSDGTFPNKEDSLAVFRRFWAQRAYGLPEVPGIFSTVRVGPAEIFLTDDRYYRGVEGDTVLGAAQHKWLVERLQQSDAPVKLVTSGTVVLAHLPIFHDWESWRRSAPDELEELLSAIESSDVRGVVLLSGDLHMAYVRRQAGRDVDGRKGPDLWEVTSSPLAIEPENKALHWPDSTLIKEIIDRENYGVIDIDLDRSGAELLLQLKDAAGRLLFEQPVDLGALRVR